MLHHRTVTSPLAAREMEREAESRVMQRGLIDCTVKGHDSNRTHMATSAGTHTPRPSSVRFHVERKIPSQQKQTPQQQLCFFIALFLNLHLCFINT